MEKPDTPVSHASHLSPREKISLVVGTLAGLKQVEATIESKFDADSALLNDISKYLFSIGGKRIRPVLCLLSAQMLGGAKKKESLYDVAAGIELIHMATLLHDDIIDRSPMRRHEASPWVKFGTPDTLLTGDFLLTRAFSLCARLDHFIINATERACIELTEGEIDERPLSVQPISIEQSLEIARKKTGSLFRLACEAAAHLADMPTSVVQSLARFGEALGVAFQVLDDILDVISTEDLLGKKAGIDLIEQKPSAVNVLWLASGDRQSKEVLLQKDPISETEVKQIVPMLRNHLCIGQARDIARRYVVTARDALATVEQSGVTLESKSKQALLALTDYVLDRME